MSWHRQFPSIGAFEREEPAHGSEQVDEAQYDAARAAAKGLIASGAVVNVAAGEDASVHLYGHRQDAHPSSASDTVGVSLCKLRLAV